MCLQSLSTPVLSQLLEPSTEERDRGTDKPVGLGQGLPACSPLACCQAHSEVPASQGTEDRALFFAQHPAAPRLLH